MGLYAVFRKESYWCPYIFISNVLLVLEGQKEQDECKYAIGKFQCDAGCEFYRTYRNWGHEDLTI